MSKLQGQTRSARTPLFDAQHSERYARHDLIRDYQEHTGANLIVMIDQIFPDNMTYLEELLHPLDSSRPLHLLLPPPVVMAKPPFASCDRSKRDARS